MKAGITICLTKSPWRVFLFLVAVSFVFRLPSLFIPYMDIDEVMWGLFANAIVNHGIPYVTVMGEKPPLLYLTYAGIFFLFGKHNYFAIHVFGIAWMALTGFLIYYFTKGLFYSFIPEGQNNRSLLQAHDGITKLSAPLIAGLAYIIFGSAPGFSMLATTGELLMNLPLVLSLIFFWWGYEKGYLKYYFFSGALVVMATLFRQQSGIQIFSYLGFLLLVFLKSWSGNKKTGSIIWPIFFLVTGCITVIILCALYLIHEGVLADFWFWNFAHNAAYIKSGFLNKHVLRNFALRTGHVLITTLPLWLLAGLRAKKIWHASKNPSARLEAEILIILYLVVSLIATIPGGRFFPHYFLQVFPPLCILAGLELVECSKFLKYFTGIWVLLLLIKTPLIPLEMQIKDQGDYGEVNKIVGEFIREHSTPQDRIFIWGWSQGIYYYSHRDPAARFISTDFLTGRSPSQDDSIHPDTSANITPGSWNMLFDDFQKHRPAYIIDTSPGNHHGYSLYPIIKFPKLYDFIQKNYELEKSIAGMDLYRLKK